MVELNCSPVMLTVAMGFLPGRVYRQAQRGPGPVYSDGFRRRRPVLRSRTGAAQQGEEPRLVIHIRFLDLSPVDATVLNAGLSMFDGAIKSNTSVFGSALAAVKDSNSNALERMSLTTNSASAAVAGARSDVAGAWQDSQTPENSMLKIAGFVVVGIAAVSLFAGKLK